MLAFCNSDPGYNHYSKEKRGKGPRGDTGKKLGIRKLERKLQTLMKIKSTNKKATVLVNRIKQHKNDLLRFVKHKEVKYHNNRTERTIRAVVIFRKLSFGSRTPEGTQYYAMLSSALETYRLKGKSILVFLKDVLKTPDKELHEITESLLPPPLILNIPRLTVTKNLL